MVGSTRIDDVYRRLRTAILSGRYRPGGRLLVSALCAEYDVSSGVLREVLPRLAGEGLVIALPQRGFRVAPVSTDDLVQLTEARVLVETAALRQAIAQGDLQWESSLVAAHHTLAGQPMHNDDGTIREEWIHAHAEFHRALLAGSPNQRLQQIASQLRDATEIYRCWSVAVGDEPDRDVSGEHRGILEAAVSRDTERAATLLTEHYQHTMQIMLRVSNDLGAEVQAG